MIVARWRTEFQLKASLNCTNDKTFGHYYYFLANPHYHQLQQMYLTYKLYALPGV